MNTVDVAIIGAGTAGLNARKAAMAEGASVAIFDPGPLGTTCARVGCMPSKLLIAAADIAHAAHQGDEFGVHSEVSIDGPGVMRRLQTMRDLFVSKTKMGIGRIGEPIRERARFIGPNTIEAGSETYRAKAIILATGSMPTVPGPWRAAGEALLTNETIFELDDLPASLLVVGAGPIGLELGQAMQRLGVRVTVLDIAGTLAGLNDPELAAVAREHLEVPMHLRHQLHSVEPTKDGVRVRFTGEGGDEHDDIWERVLVATGRAPRLDGLNLAAAGLDPLPQVDPETGQIGDSAVYVAGDASGSRLLLHEAAGEGRVAGANAARHPHTVRSPRKTPLALVFTDPQIAMVGETSQFTGDFNFAFQSRAKVLGQDAGRLQVYADANGRLTGATIIGPRAEHLGHLLAWAVQASFDVDQALSMPFYHPVVEEGLQSALNNLKRELVTQEAA